MNKTEHSDNEETEQSMEDRTFDLTVRKMKSKIYPTQMPKHVSEMSRFTDYGDNKILLAGTQSEQWPFKI